MMCLPQCSTLGQRQLADFPPAASCAAAEAKPTAFDLEVNPMKLSDPAPLCQQCYIDGARVEADIEHTIEVPPRRSPSLGRHPSVWIHYQGQVELQQHAKVTSTLEREKFFGVALRRNFRRAVNVR
jgi:hypothetical protein